MLFKNLNLKYNKHINVIAGTTFGVLQIHANSDAMRTWLWVDVLKNVNMYSSRWLIIHAFASVLGIFVVCSLIDLLRKRFIEYPLFRFWDNQRERKKLK